MKHSCVTEGFSIVLRDLDTVADLRAVETLQKEVWGCADLDVLPATQLLAAKEVGGTIIGAYDGALLVGFVYGFPGYEQGQLTHHSHMLAVHPAYRNRKLGFRLKLAQRERVLAQGIDKITWTFDPLQSKNAHLNFTKLGVIADTYKINFYGEATSSFLHQSGTDRLWVTWLIDSQRVRDRLNQREPQWEQIDAPPLVQLSSGCAPQRNELNDLLGNLHLSIEVPWTIEEANRNDPTLAIKWREATRWAFTKTLDSNYRVADFYIRTKGDQSVGVYLLEQALNTGS
jgi:predicted GNAT superfamily acetyltransferase